MAFNAQSAAKVISGGLGGSKKKGKTKEAVGRQRQCMDTTGPSRVTQVSGGRMEMEAADCEIIGGAPTTLLVKGQTGIDID